MMRKRTIAAAKRRVIHRAVVAVLGLLVALVPAPLAHAGNYTSTTDPDYTDAANWNTADVPDTTTERAIIGNVGATTYSVELTNQGTVGVPYDILSLLIGSTNTASTLTVTNSFVELHSTTGGTGTSNTGPLIIGSASGSRLLGQVDLVGGSLTASAGEVSVGSGGAGTVGVLNITNAEVNISNLRVGVGNAGGTGTVTIDGAGADVNINQFILGNGTATLNNGDWSSSIFVVIGASALGSGQLNLNGGALNAQGLAIGTNNTSTATVIGGVHNIVTNIALANGAAGDGTLEVSGGSISAAGLVVGGNAPTNISSLGSGRLDISSGLVEVLANGSSSRDVFKVFGDDDTFTMTGGRLRLGNSPTSTSDNYRYVIEDRTGGAASAVALTGGTIEFTAASDARIHKWQYKGLDDQSTVDMSGTRFVVTSGNIKTEAGGVRFATDATQNRMGIFEIAADARLIVSDEFTNNTGQTQEGLFVQGLRLVAGSEIELFSASGGFNDLFVGAGGIALSLGGSLLNPFLGTQFGDTPWFDVTGLVGNPAGTTGSGIFVFNAAALVGSEGRIYLLAIPEPTSLTALLTITLLTARRTRSRRSRQ